MFFVGLLLTSKLKLEGREPKLQGHIFQVVAATSVDSYDSTKKHVCEFIRSEFKNGNDVAVCIELEAVHEMAKPSALTAEEEKDKILFRILDVEISEYAKRKALRQTGLERTITRVISESCHGFVG